MGSSGARRTATRRSTCTSSSTSSSRTRRRSAASPRLSRADVEQASADAEAFLTALGIRNQPDSGKLEAQLRDRAYTVLVRTYDEVRRLLAFLRWEEGDADRIAPSLFAGRSARKREAVPTGDMPTEESASPLAPPPATPVRPGLPGADPFVRS